MTDAELRQQARIAARVDAGLALTLLRSGLRRRPNDPDLLWDKARIEFKADRLEAARETLFAVLEARDDVEAIALLEKVLRRLGMSGEASDWYSRRQLLRVQGTAANPSIADSSPPQARQL